MTTSTETEAAATAPPPPPPAELPVAEKKGGVFEWFFRRNAIAAARSTLDGASPRQTELHRRAKRAFELASRAHEPVDPLQAGSGVALAIELYRESAHWMLALLTGEKGATTAELWAASDPVTLKQAAGGSIELIEQLVVTRSFIDTAELPESEQVAGAAALRAFTTELAKAIEGPQSALEQLVLSRFLRVVGLFVVIVAVSLGAGIGIRSVMTKPDLAKGKPWRASSSWGECHPEKRQCGALNDTLIFFHTNEDASPWVEIDLGAPTTFSSLTVVNRSDHAPDRAVPMVAEVSTDQQAWREVAKKADTFATWTPKFGDQTARYVRVRVTRKSWLHLEKVSVHR